MTDQVGAFETFLAQNPNGEVSLTNGNPTIPFKEQDAAMYLGDDWRIRENLTLNLGIRWEFNQQGINLLAAQTLARQLNPATAFWSQALPTSLTAVQPAPNHYDHFAPNFGFAWTPHMFEGLLGHDKTVIRGGIRLSYDPAFYNIFLNVASAAPAVNSGAFACPAPCFFGLTGGEVKANLSSFLPTGGNPGIASQTHVSNNFTNPYAEEATLGIQREITSKLAAEVRWVGTHTVHEFQTVNGNPQLLCGTSGVQGGTGTNACVGRLVRRLPRAGTGGSDPVFDPRNSGLQQRIRQLQLCAVPAAREWGYCPLQRVAEPAQVPELARLHGSGRLHLEPESRQCQ